MKKILIIGILFFISLSLFSQNIKDTSYYENGAKKEILSFNNNLQLDGKCYRWNENGVLIGIASYKNGIKHGDWKIWESDGSPAYEMHYKNGEKYGTWLVYDNVGNIKEKRSF